jgi:hypothetical protein
VDTSALASWWGYAEGDSTIVGACVALVVVAALVYVAQRLRGRK